MQRTQYGQMVEPAFLGRLTSQDVGMGALYFFASHMVIRTTYYLGGGHSEWQMSAFILALLSSIAVAHLLWKPLLRLRIASTAYTSAPLISLLAGLGAVLELISIIPGMADAYFFLGAIVIGFAIGSFSDVLASTLTPRVPSSHHFRVPLALVFAVIFYFVFRLASTVSYSVGEGLLLASPLIALSCLSFHTVPSDPDAQTERRRSLQVLVWVSAAFAIVGSIVVWMAKGDVTPVESSLNYWALFEVAAVGIIIACCWTLFRLSCQAVLPQRTPLFVSILCVLPPFAIGYAMAAAFIPLSNGSLMWESSFWVLIVAIFSYDMRATPYSVDGIGAGIMFEAMCVGQMSAQLIGNGNTGLPFQVASLTFVCIYLFSTFNQLMSTEVRNATDGTAGTPLRHPEIKQEVNINLELQDTSHPDGYGHLAERYGLTEREETIFRMVATGRSANYIADELGVSFNTVRTHIRHVYEKLGVHSKQELLDIVSSAGCHDKPMK